MCKRQQQAVPSEGVLIEWSTDPLPADSWEVQQVRLQKDTSKVQLLQELCGLFRPLTNLIRQVTRLWTQLQSATSWEKLELLCAQYMTQYLRELNDDTTVPTSAVEASSSFAVEAPQASTEDPKAQDVSSS